MLHSERSTAFCVETSKPPASGLSDPLPGPVVVLEQSLFARGEAVVIGLLGCLLAFAPVFDGGTTHYPVLVVRLLILSAVLVWVVPQLRQGALAFNRCHLLPILALFQIWATVSMAWTPYKNPSVQWLVTLYCYAALFGVVSQGVKTSAQISHLLLVLAGMGACEGMMGIVQYVWLGEPRAKGTFFNPNFFATYQVAVLSVVFGMLSYTPWKELTAWRKGMLWSSGIISFAAFIMAQSRGSVMALSLAAAFISWIRFGKKAMVILCLLLVAVAVIPNPLRQRTIDVSKQDPYAFSRIEIWKSSMDRILDHPWGMGLGMYKYASFQYRFPIESDIVRFGKRAESAHNGYLQIAVELGVVGLAMFLIGIGVWMREVAGVLRSPLPNSERGLVVGAVGAVVAILAHSTVDSVFHEPALVISLIVCGGLVVRFKFLRSSDQAQWRVPVGYHPARKAFLSVCASILVVVMIQPAAGWYAFSRGEAAAKSGNEENSRYWYEWASRIEPGLTGYRDALARASVERFQQSGNPEWLLSAIEEEKLAIELNPLDGRFPYRLGTLLDQLAQQTVSPEQRELLRKQAVQAYEQGSSADPYSPLNYMGLATIALTQGRRDQATILLRQAVAYEPNYLPARIRLAELAFNAGDINGMRAELIVIESVKQKYGARVLSGLERQFLDVDPSRIEKLKASGVF